MAGKNRKDRKATSGRDSVAGTYLDRQFLASSDVVRVFRAQSPPSASSVSLLIGARGEIAWDREAGSSSFEEDARRIVDALEASLPGGTLDRLLAELLRRKASLLVVRRSAMATGRRRGRRGG